MLFIILSKIVFIHSHFKQGKGFHQVGSSIFLIYNVLIPFKLPCHKCKRVLVLLLVLLYVRKYQSFVDYRQVSSRDIAVNLEIMNQEMTYFCQDVWMLHYLNLYMLLHSQAL